MTHPIEYKRDVADGWLCWQPQPLPRAACAWVGDNAAVKSMGYRLSLYASQFANPHPEKEVVEIVYQLTSKPAYAPFCVAMTIKGDMGSPGRRQMTFDLSHARSAARVHGPGTVCRRRSVRKAVVTRSSDGHLTATHGGWQSFSPTARRTIEGRRGRRWDGVFATCVARFIPPVRSPIEAAETPRRSLPPSSDVQHQQRDAPINSPPCSSPDLELL